MPFGVFPERRRLPSLRKSFGASAPIGETETGAEKNRENKNSFRCVVGSEQARIKNLTNRDRTEKVRESGPEMFPDSIFHLERDPGPKRVTDNH